jgi:capsular exopolysaccharide synthesis family protein
MERIRQAVEQARQQRQRSEKNARSASPLPLAIEVGRAPADGADQPVLFEYTETPSITVSPETRAANRLVAAIPGHPLQDVYRMLRTRVLQEMRAKQWTSIAVTSPASGSGKSLTAINLAITIARDLSHTALLVDADLRRPSVHKYFGYQPKLGISDYLFDNAPLNEIMFHPDMDRLTVIPGRNPIGESAEMLASPRIVSLCKELGSRYPDRIVVYDIAPVLSVDDALALAPNVDCMLMVAESGATSREDLRRSLELLDGIPVIGTVLNKVQKKVTEAY